ncbi:hypothetical protein AHTJS_03925 [Acinetobacter haemolyticus]|nr:hypothetical protein AHTJS_03925 [Acinetobacter haemolyticus]
MIPPTEKKSEVRQSILIWRKLSALFCIFSNFFANLVENSMNYGFICHKKASNLKFTWIMI